MAKASFLVSLFGSQTPELKAAWKRAAEYILDGNLRFGPVSDRTRAENLAGVYLEARTSTTANQEFSVAHPFGAAPTVAIQVLNPQVINSKLLGDLTVSKAPDESRMYFTSASTNTTFTLYVER